MRLLEPCLLAHDTHLTHVSAHALTHGPPEKPRAGVTPQDAPPGSPLALSSQCEPPLSYHTGLRETPPGLGLEGSGKEWVLGLFIFIQKPNFPVPVTKPKGVSTLDLEFIPLLNLEFQGLRVQE